MNAVDKCVDGGDHSWHFFQRGIVRLRQCKKCPGTQQLLAGAWQWVVDRLP